MKIAISLLSVALLAMLCQAKLAEKVSEDDDFVVYRIPVKALDLQSQASAQFEGYEYGPSHGRSSSKSSSHSKSSSKSTGSGTGKGYGEGGSSHGHGHGHGGSSGGHGQGYGGSSGGHGQGYGGSSGGHGQGYGGSSAGYGQGYGGSSGGHGEGYGGSSGGHGQGYGGSSGGHGQGYGSGGQGYGSGGSGYGGQYRGYRGRPRGGYFSSHFDGFDSDFMNAPLNYGGGLGHSSYTPSYEGGSAGQQYDDDEADPPQVVTKTITTNSAQDTGLGHQYRQPFRLGDYLKDTPGHEISTKYGRKLSETAASDYRAGGQGFNVNDFTRTLNQGFNQPAYRSNRFAPQASFMVPSVYSFRNAGFGFPGF